MDAATNLFDTTDAVEDIINSTDKHSSDGYLNPNIFGLNLSRSQSAAPMFSSLSTSVSPPRPRRDTGTALNGGRTGSFGDSQSKKPFSIDTTDGGLDEGFLFEGLTTAPNSSRQNFFENVRDNQGDDVIPGFVKRPASTGGIERSYNNDSDKDVNSILETLGLTSLDPADDTGVPASGNRGSNGGSGKQELFFEESSMIRHKGEHVPSSSKASKYFSRGLSNDEEEIGAPRNQFGGYNHNDFGGVNNVSSSFQTGVHNMQQQSQEPSLYSQFGQQQLSSSYDSQQQQWGTQDPVQQQMYYNQQRSQYAHQEQSHPQIHNVMLGSQPTMYQINSPSAQNTHQHQLGYDFQQQQQQQNQQPHIIVQQSGGNPMYTHHQQPQFISIVPVQTAHQPPVMNGHTGYAYVQYGPDGSMQLHPQPAAMPNTQATFIMGPHGQPIALASVPINTNMGYANGPGTSPPDRMMSNLSSPRTPSRGGGLKERGPRTPSTPNGGKMRGNSLPSPRGGGKRGDKNVVVPSRMGPEAANLLNEIRSAKSRNLWTVHDITGK